MTDHEEQQPEPVGLDADQLWRFRGASYPRSRPDLSRQRRPVLEPPFSRAVRTVAWDPVRGCGCRSRAVRRATPERLPGRRGPARALPSRRVARGRETRAAARAVRRGVSGADFTRAKPSWPSPACEPPVRSEPAPAGRLLCVGCRHRTPGTQKETPRPPVPSVWPRRSGRCRGSAVCRMSRSRGRWHLRPPHVRRPHAHQSRHHAACRHSLLSCAVTADLSL